MKEQWKVSKEKLVSAEEGQHVEVVKIEPSSCKTLILFVKLILYIELALFVGWVAYALLQHYRVEGEAITDAVQEPHQQFLNEIETTTTTEKIELENNKDGTDAFTKENGEFYKSMKDEDKSISEDKPDNDENLLDTKPSFTWQVPPPKPKVKEVPQFYFKGIPNIPPEKMEINRDSYLLLTQTDAPIPTEIPLLTDVIEKAKATASPPILRTAVTKEQIQEFPPFRLYDDSVWSPPKSPVVTSQETYTIPHTHTAMPVYPSNIPAYPSMKEALELRLQAILNKPEKYITESPEVSSYLPNVWFPTEQTTTKESWKSPLTEHLLKMLNDHLEIESKKLTEDYKKLNNDEDLKQFREQNSLNTDEFITQFDKKESIESAITEEKDEENSSSLSLTSEEKELLSGVDEVESENARTTEVFDSWFVPFFHPRESSEWNVPSEESEVTSSTSTSSSSSSNESQKDPSIQQQSEETSSITDNADESDRANLSESTEESLSTATEEISKPDTEEPVRIVEKDMYVETEYGDELRHCTLQMRGDTVLTQTCRPLEESQEDSLYDDDIYGSYDSDLPPEYLDYWQDKAPWLHRRKLERLLRKLNLPSSMYNPITYGRPERKEMSKEDSKESSSASSNSYEEAISQETTSASAEVTNAAASNDQLPTNEYDESNAKIDAESSAVTSEDDESTVASSASQESKESSSVDTDKFLSIGSDQVHSSIPINVLDAIFSPPKDDVSKDDTNEEVPSDSPVKSEETESEPVTTENISQEKSSAGADVNSEFVNTSTDEVVPDTEESSETKEELLTDMQSNHRRWTNLRIAYPRFGRYPIDDYRSYRRPIGFFPTRFLRSVPSEEQEFVVPVGTDLEDKSEASEEKLLEPELFPIDK